jgi:L-threonylcarbamoyladenylate synthase
MQMIRMPEDADDYARRLYGALREADRLGCAHIFIEIPPRTDGVWRAVHDRLLRATARHGR